MNISNELKEKIINFNNADYPIAGKKMSLKRCIESITDNPLSKITLRDGKAFISIGRREFELIDVYCPDYKEPNMSLFDVSAKIMLAYEKYILQYYFDNDTTISHVWIHEENPEGFLDYNGKRYKAIDIIGVEAPTTSDKKRKVEEFIK